MKLIDCYSNEISEVYFRIQKNNFLQNHIQFKAVPITILIQDLIEILNADENEIIMYEISSIIYF